MDERSPKQHVRTMPNERADEDATQPPTQPESQGPTRQRSPAIVSSDPTYHFQPHSSPEQRRRESPQGGQRSQGQYVAPQTSPFHMSGMAAALPNYGPGQAGQQYPQMPQPMAAASPAAVPYHLGPNMQYPHQGSPTFHSQAGYGGYTPQYPAYGPQGPSPPGSYGQYYSQQQRSGQFQQAQTQFQQPGLQYVYYPPPFGQGGVSPTFSPSPQYPPNFRSPVATGNQLGVGSGLDGSPRRASSGAHGPTDSSDEALVIGTQDLQDSGTGAIPRGPPRKPKQSGFALWVGNLPPGATIIDLKDHFSRDATRDIESLFLISKSNCAFVNYRTEAACQSAMQRFHDSRFQGVRLVCRLRRTSAASSGVPSGPSSMATRRPSEPSPSKSPVLEDGGETDGPATATEPSDEADSPAAAAARSSERFFIVKSLTLQDLDQSVRNGIWATQSHNEEVLNTAYESADNVYLIFSANKSGEYFGYARMASSISEDATEIFGTILRTEVSEPTDAPKSISTPATETAPKGRIIDDSARGTIFWEAELTDDELEEEKPEEEAAEVEPQTWGKPFKIEWISTTRLPFYRTRGLRNPWNANREVKIARDGTELEPAAGRRLIQLFHRPGTAPPPPPPQIPTAGGPHSSFS